MGITRPDYFVYIENVKESSAIAFNLISGFKVTIKIIVSCKAVAIIHNIKLKCIILFIIASKMSNA